MRLIHRAALAVAATAASVAAPLAAVEGIIPNGIYNLANHPDGSVNPGGTYGMVLRNFQGRSHVLFDFNIDGSDMRLRKSGDNLWIYGRARELYKDGSGDWIHGDFWQIEFRYKHNASHPEDGDAGYQDVRYNAPGGMNTGAMTNLTSGEVIPLHDVANKDAQPYTFQLGDEDGSGHRLYDTDDGVDDAAYFAEIGVETDYSASNGGDGGNNGGGNGGGNSGGGDDDDSDPVPISGWGWIGPSGDTVQPQPRDFLFIIKKRVRKTDDNS